MYFWQIGVPRGPTGSSRTVGQHISGSIFLGGVSLKKFMRFPCPFEGLFILITTLLCRMCLQHLTDSWVTLVVNKYCIISPWVSGFRDRHCMYHSLVPFGAFTCHFFIPFSKRMHLYILLLLPTPLEFKINVRMAHLLFCTMVCICLRFLTYYFLEIVHEELMLFSFIFVYFGLD